MVPADAVSFTLLQEQLHSVLDTLSEREAGVVSMRFGLSDGQPKTLDEIGKVYGVTRERIRQIESKTMSKLRHPSRSQAPSRLSRLSLSGPHRPRRSTEFHISPHARRPSKGHSQARIRIVNRRRDLAVLATNSESAVTSGRSAPGAAYRARSRVATTVSSAAVDAPSGQADRVRVSRACRGVSPGPALTHVVEAVEEGLPQHLGAFGVVRARRARDAAESSPGGAWSGR